MCLTRRPLCALRCRPSFFTLTRSALVACLFFRHPPRVNALACVLTHSDHTPRPHTLPPLPFLFPTHTTPMYPTRTLTPTKRQLADTIDRIADANPDTPFFDDPTFVNTLADVLLDTLPLLEDNREREKIRLKVGRGGGLPLGGGVAAGCCGCPSSRAVADGMHARCRCFESRSPPNTHKHPSPVASASLPPVCRQIDG